MSNVSVFGGSQCSPGDGVYQEAERLGKLLALSGHTVLTGGYIGVMGRFSRRSGRWSGVGSPVMRLKTGDLLPRTPG
jgi:predicted Rossmann-fold nucleotide-binding protein